MLKKLAFPIVFTIKKGWKESKLRVKNIPLKVRLRVLETIAREYSKFFRFKIVSNSSKVYINPIKTHTYILLPLALLKLYLSKWLNLQDFSTIHGVNGLIV